MRKLVIYICLLFAAFLSADAYEVLVVKSSIENSILKVKLEFSNDTEVEQYPGASLVLKFGDGYQLNQSFVAGQKEYLFDLSGHPAISPGDFYVITLESLNNVIQTQKIRI